MLGLDVRIVVADGQALGVGEGLLKLGRELVESHLFRTTIVGADINNCMLYQALEADFKGVEPEKYPDRADS
jgi:hypothetical protein